MILKRAPWIGCPDVLLDAYVYGVGYVVYEHYRAVTLVVLIYMVSCMYVHTYIYACIHMYTM